MEKYTVCVYAICKNEEKFAERWYNSMKEADKVFVLDTGSTDSSAELLESMGATVKTAQIVPWRFDTARNMSLDMVGEDCDICVCTDIDEVFRPGWRTELEKVWDEDVKRVRYRYTWNFNPDGSEGVVFYSDKIHARNGFRWVHPVHEVLEYDGNEYKTVTASGIQLDHHADNTKSRSQYLPLLELAVKEDPQNDRNTHYLGREYMYRKMYDKAIDTLKAHLSLPSATWADERCASERYIAKSYELLGNNKEAGIWYLKAVAEAPYLREPWIDAGLFAYKLKDWYMLVFCCEKALEIKENPNTYITEATSFGSLVYDLASVGYYYTGNSQKASQMIREAISLSPDNERLKENKIIIENSVN